jgi:hypothetical protein
MNEIVREWQMHFFSKPLLELILCIAIIIAIRHRNKHSILKFVPIYITIFLLIFLLTEARTISSPKEKNYVWINALCEYIDCNAAEKLKSITETSQKMEFSKWVNQQSSRSIDWHFLSNRAGCKI